MDGSFSSSLRSVLGDTFKPPAWTPVLRLNQPFRSVVESCLVRSVICNRASCILLINEKKMSKRIFQESRRGTYVRFNSKVAKDCIYADAYCVIVTLGIKKSETIFRGNR